MESAVWLSFVGTVLILALTPGPSVLLATANSMKYGRKKTIGTILGDLSANSCQIFLASIGLASFVLSSGEIFQIVKWCGVAYLIFLGISKIMASSKIQLPVSSRQDRSFIQLYAEGFMMSAANPKAIVFFAAFFPLFIEESTPFLPQIFILAVTFLVIDGLSLLLYTLFAARLKTYLENQRKVHLQNKIVGSLLIISGILLSMVKKVST